MDALDETTQLRVLIHGVGAIGGFYAFVLRQSPRVHLTALARSNHDILKAKGLDLDSFAHGKRHVDFDQVVKSPSEAQSCFDYILCCNKAIDQDEIAVALKPVVNDQTSIVILQNGVGNEDPFRAVFPRVTILSGVVWIGVRPISANHYDHFQSERTEIGIFLNANLPPTLETQRLSTLVSLFACAPSPIEVMPAIQTQRWSKVVWNVAWNALTTLTMVDVGTWLASSAGAVAVTRALMAEVMAVAGAVGVQLDPRLGDVLIERAKGHDAFTTSMQFDARSGRRLEVENILGVPVKRGRELGVNIPTLEMVYALVLAADVGLRTGTRYKDII